PVDEEVEQLHRGVELTGARHRDRNPGFVDHQADDVVSPRRKHIAQPSERARPLGRWQVWPGPLVEGAACGGDGCAGVDDGTPRRANERLSSRRIYHRRNRFRCSPFTVDEETLVLRSGWDSSGLCTHSTLVTRPDAPSTSTTWPVFSTLLPVCVPTTQGIPNSRATTAAWDISAPVSTTTAAA